MIIYIVTLSIIIILYNTTRSTIRRRNLPPGPTKLPLIGNLLQVPKEKPWLAFNEWGKKFGNVLSVKIFSQDMIILNSAEDAHELLNKRSAIYSSRPTLTMASELMDWRNVIVFRPPGSELTKMRRFFHQALTPQMWPLVEEETERFAKWVLRNPEDFKEHIRRLAGSIALRISYGYTVCEPEKGVDPLVELVETAMKEFSIATEPGAFMVDTFPWMKYIPTWFPGATFKRTAAVWHKDFHAMLDVPYAYTKAQLREGTAKPSLVSIHSRPDMSPEEDHLLKSIAGSLYSGGSDTTVSSITTFFLAMCLHPEIQRKAQAEVDRVIGVEQRLPKITDRQSLPYVEAVMKEVFRWIPVAPLGVPHRAAEDDSFKGHFIPSGATVMSNIRAMSRDPKYFPDGESFRPERFLEEDISNAHFANPLHFTFGFGRRVCPGQKLAEVSVFLAIATTLALFDITKALSSETGLEMESKIEINPGIISELKPFPCKVSPRSQQAVDLIMAVGDC